MKDGALDGIYIFLCYRWIHMSIMFTIKFINGIFEILKK